MNPTKDPQTNTNIQTTTSAPDALPLLLERAADERLGDRKRSLGRGEVSTKRTPLDSAPRKPSAKSPLRNPQSAIRNPQSDIARLPKATRDMINLMLDDNLPYRVIVDELAETAAGITPQSLSDWLKSGYEDYLKTRQSIEGAKTQAEFAADLLRELGGIDVTTIHRGCLALAVTQIFTAIDNYGDETLRKMLHVNPASYLTMINTLCNMTNSTLKLEDHRIARESARSATRPATTQSPTTAHPDEAAH